MNPLGTRIEASAEILNFRDGEDYLARAIRPVLKRAIDEDVLAIGIEQLGRHVRVTNAASRKYELTGGRLNFGRTRDLVDLWMRDGGWITFAATLGHHDDGLALLAYSFERVFAEDYVPRWVRYDLNPEGHANDVRGLRAHLHPGNDDLQLPAPIVAPHELLELFLGETGPTGDRRERSKG